MTERLGHNGLRLLGERFVRERRRVDRLTGRFTGRSRLDRARRVDRFGLDVARIVLADARRRCRAVVVRPDVRRFAPLVTERFNVLNGLCLRREQCVRERRSVGRFALRFAGRGLRDLGGRIDRLGRARFRIVRAGRRCRDRLVVFRPLVRDRVRVLLPARNEGHVFGDLRLEVERFAVQRPALEDVAFLRRVRLRRRRLLVVADRLRFRYRRAAVCVERDRLRDDLAVPRSQLDLAVLHQVDVVQVDEEPEGLTGRIALIVMEYVGVSCVSAVLQCRLNDLLVDVAPRAHPVCAVLVVLEDLRLAAVHRVGRRLDYTERRRRELHAEPPAILHAADALVLRYPVRSQTVRVAEDDLIRRILSVRVGRDRLHRPDRVLPLRRERHVFGDLRVEVEQLVALVPAEELVSVLRRVRLRRRRLLHVADRLRFRYRRAAVRVERDRVLEDLAVDRLDLDFVVLRQRDVLRIDRDHERLRRLRIAVPRELVRPRQDRMVVDRILNALRAQRQPCLHVCRIVVAAVLRIVERLPRLAAVVRVRRVDDVVRRHRFRRREQHADPPAVLITADAHVFRIPRKLELRERRAFRRQRCARRIRRRQRPDDARPLRRQRDALRYLRREVEHLVALVPAEERIAVLRRIRGLFGVVAVLDRLRFDRRFAVLERDQHVVVAQRRDHNVLRLRLERFVLERRGVTAEAVRFRFGRRDHFVCRRDRFGDVVRRIVRARLRCRDREAVLGLRPFVGYAPRMSERRDLDPLDLDREHGVRERRHVHAFARFLAGRGLDRCEGRFSGLFDRINAAVVRAGRRRLDRLVVFRPRVFDRVFVCRPDRLELDRRLDGRCEIVRLAVQCPAREDKAFLRRCGRFGCSMVIAHALRRNFGAAVRIERDVEVFVLINDLPIHDLDLRIGAFVFDQDDVRRIDLDHERLRVLLIAVPCELVRPLHGTVFVYEPFNGLDRQRHPCLHVVPAVGLLAVLRVVEGLPRIAAVVRVRRAADVGRRHRFGRNELEADPVAVLHSADARIRRTERQRQILEPCAGLGQRAGRVRKHELPDDIRPLRGQREIALDRVGLEVPGDFFAVLLIEPAEERAVVLRGILRLRKHVAVSRFDRRLRTVDVIGDREDLLPVDDLDGALAVLHQRDVLRADLDHECLRRLLIAVPCELVRPRHRPLFSDERSDAFLRQRHPCLHVVPAVGLLAVLRVVEGLPRIAAVVRVRRAADVGRRHRFGRNELEADPVAVLHSADARIRRTERQRQILEPCAGLGQHAGRVRKHELPDDVRPRCFQGDTALDQCAEVVRFAVQRPACEGVAVLRRCLGCDDRRAVRYGDRIDRAAAVRIERDGVFVRFARIGRRVGRFAGDGDDLGRPSVERVGVLRVRFLRRRFARIDRGLAVCDRLALEHRAVFVDEADLVLDRLPVRLQGQRLIDVLREVVCVVSVVPAVEDVTFLRRIGRGLRNGFALRHFDRRGLAAVIRVERDRDRVDDVVHAVFVREDRGAELAFHDVLRLDRDRELAAGHEVIDALVIAVDRRFRSVERTAGDRNADRARGVVLRVRSVQRRIAGDRAAGDVHGDVETGRVLRDRDARAARRRAAAVRGNGRRRAVAGDHAARDVQHACADLDARCGAGDSRAFFDVDRRTAVQRDADIVAADLCAVVDVDHGIAACDVAHHPDHAVDRAVDIDRAAVAGLSVGFVLIQNDRVIALDRRVSGDRQSAVLSALKTVQVDRARYGTVLDRDRRVVLIDVTGQRMSAEIEREVPAFGDHRVLGNVLEQFDRLAAVHRVDRGIERCVQLVADLGNRFRPLRGQFDILVDRRIEVELGLAVKPAREDVTVLRRVFRLRDLGILFDRYNDRIGTVVRVERDRDALGQSVMILFRDPDIAVRDRQRVRFRGDPAVLNARGTGLLIDKDLRAGGSVERAAVDGDGLLHVHVTVGQAVVTVERTAVDRVAARCRRVDRRAEVVPPFVVRRRRVRRIGTAVDRDGRGRRRIVRADRCKVRDDRRAVAVRGSEDRRAAVQHVYAVHAVGACARCGQRAVFDRQLAAVDRDQCFAVEGRAVCRAGDPAVAGDREVARRRDCEQFGRVGRDLVSVEVQRDFLVDRDALDLDVLQQDDHVAVVCRCERFRERRVQRIADRRDRRQRRIGRDAVHRTFDLDHDAVFRRVFERDLLVCELDLHDLARAERVCRAVLEERDDRFAGAYAFRRERFFERCVADVADLRDRFGEQIAALFKRQPRVAVRNRQGVRFRGDPAVLNARGTGLAVHKDLRAGGSVERAAVDGDGLLHVHVTVGQAVVTVERTAVDRVAARCRRVDRRAEVVPPFVVRRRRVRRIGTAVDNDRCRGGRVVRADRRKVRGDRRSVAVRCAEDRSAAVQHVHAVHAVGACARRGQRAVFDRQLAAVDRDQCFAVEVRAVRRSGDPAVAGDRHVAGRRDCEQFGRVGADFVSAEIQRDFLVDRDALDLDVLQQLDGVAVLRRCERFLELCIHDVADRSDRVDPRRLQGDIALDRRGEDVRFAVQRPACEDVPVLRRRRGFRDRRVVINLDRIDRRFAVRERDRHLLRRPVRGEHEALGDRLREVVCVVAVEPACEVVAFLLGVCGLCDRSILIDGHTDRISAVVIDELDRQTLDPLQDVDDVLRRRVGDRDGPHIVQIEVIAFTFRNAVDRRLRDGVHRLRIAVVDVELLNDLAGEVVRVDDPDRFAFELRRQRDIRGDRRIEVERFRCAFREPAEEDVVLLFRIRRLFRLLALFDPLRLGRRACAFARDERHDDCLHKLVNARRFGLDPHLVIADRDLIILCRDKRERADRIRVVCADALCAVAYERAARDLHDRIAVRITAVVDDERVARGVCAVAVVAVFRSRAGAVQRAAGDRRLARLHVDRRCAGDRAAVDRQVAGRQVDRDVVGRNDRAFADDDVRAGQIRTVGADRSVAAVFDLTEDRDRRRLASRLAERAVAPDHDLPVDGCVGRERYVRVVVRVEAAFDRTVLYFDRAGVHRQSAGQLMTAEIERDALADRIACFFDILQQNDRIAVLRRRDRLRKAGVADVADRRDRVADDPPFVFLHRALARDDVGRFGFLAEVTLCDESLEMLALDLAGEVSAGDRNGHVFGRFIFQIDLVQRLFARQAAAADRDLDRQVGRMLRDRNRRAGRRRAASVRVLGERAGCGDRAARDVQFARADFDAGFAGDGCAFIDVHDRITVQRDRNVVACDLRAAVDVDHGVACEDVAHHPDDAVDRAVDFNRCIVAVRRTVHVREDDRVVRFDRRSCVDRQLARHAAFVRVETVDPDGVLHRAVRQLQLTVQHVCITRREGMSVHVEDDVPAAVERDGLARDIGKQFDLGFGAVGRNRRDRFRERLVLLAADDLGHVDLLGQFVDARRFGLDPLVVLRNRQGVVLRRNHSRRFFFFFLIVADLQVSAALGHLDGISVAERDRRIAARISADVDHDRITRRVGTVVVEVIIGMRGRSAFKRTARDGNCTRLDINRSLTGNGAVLDHMRALAVQLDAVVVRARDLSVLDRDVRIQAFTVDMQHRLAAAAVIITAVKHNAAVVVAGGADIDASVDLAVFLRAVDRQRRTVLDHNDRAAVVSAHLVTVKIEGDRLGHVDHLRHFNVLQDLDGIAVDRRRECRLERSVTGHGFAMGYGRNRRADGVAVSAVHRRFDDGIFAQIDVFGRIVLIEAAGDFERAVAGQFSEQPGILIRRIVELLRFAGKGDLAVSSLRQNDRDLSVALCPERAAGHINISAGRRLQGRRLIAFRNDRAAFDFDRRSAGGNDRHTIVAGHGNRTVVDRHARFGAAVAHAIDRSNHSCCFHRNRTAVDRYGTVIDDAVCGARRTLCSDLGRCIDHQLRTGIISDDPVAACDILALIRTTIQCKFAAVINYVRSVGRNAAVGCVDNEFCIGSDLNDGHAADNCMIRQIQRDLLACQFDRACNDRVRDHFDRFAVLRRRKCFFNRCVQRIADLGDRGLDRIGHDAVNRFADRQDETFRNRIGELDLIVCFIDLQNVARDERILRALQKRDDFIDVAVPCRRCIRNGRVADVLHQSDRVAHGVRERFLGFRIRVQNRVLAFLAHGKCRCNREHAALNGELCLIRRQRTSVLAVHNGDRSTCSSSADDTFAAAERVARQSNRHTAGILESNRVPLSGKRIARNGCGPIAAADVDTVLDAGRCAAGDRQIFHTGELRKAVPARHGQTGQRDLVCACTGSDTECDRRRSFSGELAVAHRDVVRIVVLVGRIRLARCLCVRNVDERVIVCCRIIGKLHVLNGQGVCAFISSVAIDVELTRDGLSVAVDRQVQTGFLMDHGDFRHVRKQGNGYVAGHFMRRIKRFLQRGIGNVSDLCDLLDYYVVITVRILNVCIVFSKETDPIRIIRYSLIFISQRLKRAAGDESFGCIVAVRVAVLIEQTAADRDFGRFRLFDADLALELAAGDINVCSVTEDIAFKRTAGDGVLRVVKRVSVRIIIECIGPTGNRSAGDIQCCFHRFTCITARKLNPDAGIPCGNRTAGDIDRILFGCAVGKLTDCHAVAFD